MNQQDNKPQAKLAPAGRAIIRASEQPSSCKSTSQPKATTATIRLPRTSTQTRTMSMGAIKRVNQVASGPVNQTNENNNRGQKPIKKAFVRFDDYLDLNEENMRRSCKRLMNRLYSGRGSEPPPPALASTATEAIKSAPAISLPAECATRPPPLPPMRQQTGASVPQNDDDVGQARGLNLKTPATNGKSYLRSQYERRQQRQLQLMMGSQSGNSNISEMQPETPTIVNAIGARACLQQKPRQLLHQNDDQRERQQQQQQKQDLVAKSHELSKRRFFEKLERRTSMKNLNSSTQIPDSLSKPTVGGETETIRTQPDRSSEGAEQVSFAEEATNVGAGKLDSNNDELLLKVYQSIASGESDGCGLGEVNVGNSTPAAVSSTPATVDSMLQRLAGAPILPIQSEEPTSKTYCYAEDLADQLIGFHSPSSQLVKHGENQRSQGVVGECSLFGEAIDESAFEIKVPATEGDADGFINSGLLVVKQLDSSTISRAGVNSSNDCEEDASDEPPTSSGLHKKVEEAMAVRTSTQVASNKIDGEHSVNASSDIKFEPSFKDETISPMSTSHRATASVSSSSELPATSTRRDNQHDEEPPTKLSTAETTTLVSATISATNDNENNNNKMKTSDEVDSTAPGSTTDQVVDYNESAPSEDPPDFRKQATSIGSFGGETNRAKNHEAPEMAATLFVGQSGGSNICSGMNANGASLKQVALVSPNDSVQIENTAQQQAQQVVSLQTIITKPEIRDVLPEASRANRLEASTVVSGLTVERGTTEKVTIKHDQVNEDKRQQEESIVGCKPPLSSEDQYANPVTSKSDPEGNNVNHDVSGARDDYGNLESMDNDDGDHKLGCHRQHDQLLIEPFKKPMAGSALIRNQSNNSAEEDGGSSCSSSGFGASASSDGGCAFSTIDTTITGGRKRAEQRPSSLAITSRNDDHSNADCDPLYESVRWTRNQRGSRMQLVDEFPDYKQLVGPDQAYPSKERPSFLVENHGYASVLNRCESIRLDESIVLEKDDLVVGYANLPRNKALSNVGYATIRHRTTAIATATAPTTTTASDANRQHLFNDSASDASFGRNSCLTSGSAKSGGFSALTPAHTDCPSTNNFESMVSLSQSGRSSSSQSQQQNNRKSSSILRKFGSLVSKAFNSAGNQTLTSKISKSSTPPPQKNLHRSQADAAKQQLQSQDAIVGSGCLIEPDSNHKATPDKSKKQQQVDEADLVILPTKYVNQRKLQQQPQGNQAERLNDGRLSREKSSRRTKRPNFGNSPTSSASSSSASPSSSSSASSESRRHRARQLKSSSLSEELESLMSRSSQSNYCSKKAAENRRKYSSSQLRSRSACRPPKKTPSGRIDIDCISPGGGAAPNRRNCNGDTRRAELPQCKKTTVSNQQRSTSHSNNQAKSVQPAESEPSLTNSSENCQIQYNQQHREPISGFWSLTSLMNTSHANRASSTNKVSIKKSRKRTPTARGKENPAEPDHASFVYSNLQPFAAGYKLYSSLVLPQEVCNGDSFREEDGEEQETQLGKYQSLNLYQNLLRNYVKRRNRRHDAGNSGAGHSHNHHSHHHHRHHSHGHHHYRTHRVSSRGHAHHHSSRCGRNCGRLGSSAESLVENRGKKDRSFVWGQLIEINKSDGSQVIELQRSPGKSWGFFVARGAIDNSKGIFISRMYDNVTSRSLSGLLSIGDRLLAIDECPVEPDHDILRVNQMISKKSKILLKVKPFKG